MDPFQQQTGQYSQFVQPYQGYVQATTPTAFYPQYQSYQQQPYTAYQAVPGALTGPQTTLGVPTPYPQVGYYAQPTAVAPVVQPTSSVSTATSALSQGQPTLVAGSIPVSTTQKSEPSSQLSEEQKKYVQQYQQWQQQYQQWLQQNQNHPDQKQFQQWQQQMQNWQQQYSQIIPAQKTNGPKDEDTKQQNLSQQLQQPPTQQQTPQQKNPPQQLQPPQQPNQPTTVITNPGQIHAQNVSNTGSSGLSGGYSQQPHARQQHQPFGNQVEPTGHQAQNVAQQMQSMGKQTLNISHQSQTVGHPTQGLGYQIQNRTYQTESIGHEDQNMGHQTQNNEHQTQNIHIGPQNHNMGHQMQGFGHQAQITDHQTTNRRHQSQPVRHETPSMRHQNQQTAYQSQSVEQSPSSPSMFNKPSSDQGYTHPGNQGYNPVINKPHLSQGPMPHSQQQQAGAAQSHLHHQQDYLETDDRETIYQHGSKDTRNELKQDFQHPNSIQPSATQYHPRPIRSQFNEQNRFLRPEGMQATQSPRPYRQFRPEPTHPREGLYPRDTQSQFSPGNNRPRGPAPRGNRPPFPDEITRFRSPQPQRPNLQRPRPQFEHQPRQRSPMLRPPMRALSGQRFQRPLTQNFGARGPRPQEPRVRQPTFYEDQDLVRSQQSIDPLSQSVARSPVQRLPRPPAQPSARPQTQASTRPPAQPTRPHTQPLSQPPAQTLTRHPAQPLTRHPAQPLTRPPNQPIPRLPSQPLTRPPAQPLNQAPVQTQTQPPAQQLDQHQAQPLTGAPKQPLTQSPAQPSIPFSINKSQPTSTGSAMPSNKTTEIQSKMAAEKKATNIPETPKDPFLANRPAKTEITIKQDPKENEVTIKQEPIIKQETTDPETAAVSKTVSEPSQDKVVTSLEIEILKRQQDQLKKLKELEILQRNQKAKQEEAKDVAKCTDHIEKDTESIRENRGEVREEKQSNSQYNENKTDRGVSEKSFQPCRNFPDCGLAEECEFHHPLCKFDIKCKKPDCPYWHTVPLDQRYSGKKLLAIQEGRYFEDGVHDIPEHLPEFDERDGRRTGDPYDAARPDYDRLPPGDPYYERQDYPRVPPDDYREYYDDRGYPSNERDEFDRRHYDEFGPQDRFDRRTPPPRIDRELERGRACREERLPPPRDFGRYPDEPLPFRDRFGDRGLDPYERELMYRDADRDYFDRLRERDLFERGYDRYEDDPIFLEPEREWRRDLDRRRDPYDDPYFREPFHESREPFHESRERRLPYDFPERYPDDFGWRRDRDRDLFDDRLDSRRALDREFRHPDDEHFLRDRHLDERNAFQRREAFDYNHGGKSDRDVNRDSRKPRDIPAKPKPKPKVTAIGTLLDKPGRETRPDRIVFIFRGLPGSGKTHIARLIKDKELACGAPTPRILSLDDYFLQETSTYEKDPETGKKILVKGTEYVYEPELEESYRNSLFKAFNKTLDDGFFPMVILDCVNNKVEYFERFWSQAKQKGFEVYVAEINADPNDCAKRNTHHRTLEEINEMLEKWEETPRHHTRLDVRSLLQDAAITEVEMEAIEDPEESKKAEGEADDKKEINDLEEKKEDRLSKSRWDDLDVTELQLDKLDGLRLRGMKRKTHDESPLPDDEDDDPYDEREEDMRLGKKRII